jgi:hypothetical protein
MKPIKASFTQVINAVADGKGVKKKPQRRWPIQASEPPDSKESKK